MSVKHYNKETGKWEIFPGTIGAPGLSAYQSAVKLGYRGTEEEWIESLHGKDSYTIAVENGYKGTEEEYNLALAVIPNIVDKVENPDESPTTGSKELISSGGVKEALDSINEQTKIEFSRVDQSISEVNNKVNNIVDSGIKAQVTALIVDNLDSSESDKSLSANQGKVLKEMINQITSGTVRVVESLPEEGEENVIYLVKKAQARTDLYEEYLWVNDAWELIGNTSIDLSNYYTKSDVDTKISNLDGKITGSSTTISSISNNGTKTPKLLRIQKNGSELTSFDGSEEKVANIEIPTTLSDLNVTSEDIIDALGYTPANSATSGSGDVTGPNEVTANNIPIFSDASGKLIKDSGFNVNSFSAKKHTHNTSQIIDLSDNLKTINGQSILGTGDITSDVIVLKLSTKEEESNQNVEEITKILDTEGKIVLVLVDNNPGYFYEKIQKLPDDIFSAEMIVCSIVDNTLLKYRLNTVSGELNKIDEINFDIVAAYRDSSIGINLDEESKNNNFIAQGGIIFPEDSNEARLEIINSYKLSSLTQRRPCLINIKGAFFYGDLFVEGGYVYVEYNASIHHITVLKISCIDGSFTTERVYDLDTFNNEATVDLLSYGVEWDDTVADPHLTRIGNPLLHKSLPIQSAFKGCVANKGEINYYLDPNDWSKKENGEPSVLDGTDGTVRVHIPRFYGKSGTNGSKHWVRVSQVQIDPSWTEIPEMLVDAYLCTVDTTNPETLKAVSVVNTTPSFRGGSNRSDYDQYLSSNVGRTDLGKSRTNLTKTVFRTYVRNAGSEILCYDYYKWIFGWLYIIEYANFNVKEAYNSSLTSEGYHQGGLGEGVANFTQWNTYNGFNPLIPCGYCNEFGNFTGVKDFNIPETVLSDDVTVPSTTLKVPRWRGFDNPFGHLWCGVEGILLQGVQEEEEYKYYNVYTTTDPNNFGGGETQKDKMKFIGKQIYTQGYTKSLALGETGEIISSSMGGSSTTYMCSYVATGEKNGNIKSVLVKGCATGVDSVSPLSLEVSKDESHLWPGLGFRSVSLVTKW